MASGNLAFTNPIVLADWVRQQARPLEGTPGDFDDLLELIGDARVVMLGEASHGTHEFYAQRALLTRRLIEEKGFQLVAIEGDWPDAARVDRYVRGGSGTAREALEGFKRFPSWMWRNQVVLDFVGWLRGHNEALPEARKVGFHGLDVYSLHASMGEVVRYLEQVDPLAARRARERYACFDAFGEDTVAYALSAHFFPRSCEEDVVTVLRELQAMRLHGEGAEAEEALFQAELNALAAFNAERYYRRMVYGGAETWNLRDRHMVHVLNRLLQRRGPEAKAILWEHNTHIGDFRATEERHRGEINVGQLVREQYGREAIAVGFGTHHGTVTAASAWDEPGEFMRVPPARVDSYEAIFHHTGLPGFYLPLARLEPSDVPGGWLYQSHPERAIGVVYNPAREAVGNYLGSRLARRYDAYLFFDETLAVEPLDLGPATPGLEGYPTGL